jgi:hypothetical protein
MLNIIATAILGLVAWISLSVVELKTETAVITQKVSENHKMLTVLWDDFLEGRNGNLAWVDTSAGVKATSKEKIQKSP